jgi:hypothetical protein
MNTMMLIGDNFRYRQTQFILISWFGNKIIRTEKIIRVWFAGAVDNKFDFIV